MGFVAIGFIVINLAVPYYIWGIKADKNQMNWSALNKNIERIIQAQGGFNNCPTKELSPILVDLCKESAIKKQKETVPVERAGNDVLFACEVGENSAVLNFQPLRKAKSNVENEFKPKFQLEPSGELTQEPGTSAIERPAISLQEKVTALEQTWEKFDCQSITRLGRGPAFLFNLKGQLTHIDFSSMKGERQSVPIENCRAKLKAATKLAPAVTNKKDFLEKLPRIKGDPEDLPGVNFTCFQYDIAAGWKKWRSQYPQ